MPTPAQPLSIINQPVVETMDFYDALRAAADGHKITKLEWADDRYYGLLLDNKLMLHKPDGTFYPWTISDGDLAGMDWVILE